MSDKDKKNTGDSNNMPVTQKPHRMTQKIGSTTYDVSVHFSKTSQESINDKILRLIRSDPQK